MYGNVQPIDIDLFDSAIPGPPVPPSLWLAAEEDELPPLLAYRRGLRYEILDGTEIWRAAQLAQLYRVPALLTDQRLPLQTPSKVSTHQQDPITEAEALQILKETHRLTDGQLASHLSWSRKKVSDYRRLLQLDEEVRSLVREGRLSVSKAAELVSIPPNRQRQLAERTVRLGLSLADLRSLARRWKPSRRKNRENEDSTPDMPSAANNGVEGYSADPDIARLERNLEEVIGARVRIDHQARHLIIAYSAPEVLDGIIERLLPPV